MRRTLFVLTMLASVGSRAAPAPDPIATLRRDHVDAAALERLPATATLDEVIAALRDPWTRRLDRRGAAAFLADVSGQPTVGIGLPELLSIDLDASGHQPFVVAPLPGSPAAAAGLRPMDRLLAIDGVATHDLPWRDVMRRLRGPAGSVVRLQIGRGPAQLSMSIRRQRLPARKSVRAERRDGILHLTIERFDGTTVAAVRAALAGAPSLPTVVDLRDNPGGDVTACLDVAGALAGTGEVARVIERHGSTVLSSQGAALSQRRLAVLVNEGTASAAELLATALAARQRAPIVGAPTRGKCLVHSAVPDGEGGLVLFTQGRLARLDNTELCAAGVPLDVATAAGSGDPQLATAMRLVAGDRR